MSKRMSSKFTKKAVMGIETLVIFIAMILVAGVAAAVLIRTSGLLQQKALAVSGEALDRVATGIELLQLTANANTTESTVKELELLLRLSAGSDTLKLRDLGLNYISGEDFLTASLAHPAQTGQVEETIDFLNGTNISLYNMDIVDSDTAVDKVRFVSNITGNGDDGLQFYLTKAGLINVSFELDLNGTSGILLEDIPILLGEEVYGFINLEGDFSSGMGAILNNSLASQNFTLVVQKFADSCRFDTIRPNVQYCLDPRLGDTDMNFESGELLMLRYKLTDANKIFTDTKVDISLIPTKAIVTTISFFTPEAFPTYKVTLWP